MTLGINFGNNYNSGETYSSTQVNADLAFLKKYVSVIRIALAADASTNGINNTKTIALAAKALGFYTIWGVTAGGNINNTQYANWKTNVPTYATWAQSNSMDEFFIGNEESWNASQGIIGTQTATGVRTDVRGLVASAKANFTRGSVAYCDSQGTRAGWISEGIGNLDKIYFNVYDNIDNFIAINAQLKSNFTTKLALSEWAAEHEFVNMSMTEAQYAQELSDRLTLLNTLNIPSTYFFTWRYGSDDGSNWEIITTTGKYHTGLRNVFSVPRLATYTARSSAARSSAAHSYANHSTATSSGNYSLSANGNTTAFRIRPLDTSVLRISTTSAITIGASLKLTSKTASDNHTLAVLAFNFGSNLGYDLQIDPTTGAIHVFYGSTTADSAISKVPYGAWTHVVYRINGTALDVFVGGSSVYSATITRVNNDTGTGTSEVTYLGEEGSEFRTLRGQMKNFFSVKSSLSAGQIATIAAAPSTLASYPTVDLLYRFNEGKGTIALDESGNSNHAAITNATYSTDVP